MKNETRNRRKAAVGVIAAVLALLMVSSATAVPYAQEKEIPKLMNTEPVITKTSEGVTVSVAPLNYTVDTISVRSARMLSFNAVSKILSNKTSNSTKQLLRILLFAGILLFALKAPFLKDHYVTLTIDLGVRKFGKPMKIRISWRGVLLLADGVVLLSILSHMKRNATQPPGQNRPPNVPSDIRPADGGLVKDCTADLTWLASDPDRKDTVLVDVWFGPDPGRMYLIQQNTTLKSTPTPGLQSYTNYTWQVVAWDNHGACTKGPVWHFHTGNLADLPEK